MLISMSTTGRPKLVHKSNGFSYESCGRTFKVITVVVAVVIVVVAAGRNREVGWFVGWFVSI